MPVVTTWNLENLYRPGGEHGPRTEGVYERKLAHLADRLVTGPGCGGMQEVRDPDALQDLANRLPDGWYAVLSSHPDRRGLRV